MTIDLRAKYAFEAIGTSKSMVLAVPGQGSQYIGAYLDSNGEWLIGDNTYRIHLPKGVPAGMFWSLTVYDNETRSMIPNDLGRPRRDPLPLGLIRLCLHTTLHCRTTPARPRPSRTMFWCSRKRPLPFRVFCPYPSQKRRHRIPT
jgi:hypothetical protein